MASIMTSMPLLGDKRPKVRMTGRPGESELGLRRGGLDEGDVGNAVRDDIDLVRRNSIHRLQELAALFGHDDDPGRCADNPVQHAPLWWRRLGQDRVQRGDDRHGQPREQRHDVAAGLTAEDAEFMLQRDVELAGIEGIGRPDVDFDPVVGDLEANGGRIIVGVAVVGHRHDAGVRRRIRFRDRLLQVGREGGDPAAAG